MAEDRSLCDHAPLLAWMVCHNCGHTDSGPDGAVYECAVCGSCDGEGAESQAAAERRAVPIIARGRRDV